MDFSQLMERFNERRRKADEELQARLAARTPEQVAEDEEDARRNQQRVADWQFHRLVLAHRKLKKQINSHLRKCAACKAQNYCAPACEDMDDLLKVEKRLDNFGKEQ